MPTQATIDAKETHRLVHDVLAHKAAITVRYGRKVYPVLDARLERKSRGLRASILIDFGPEHGGQSWSTLYAEKQYIDVVELSPSVKEPPPPEPPFDTLDALQQQTPAQIDEALSAIWQRFYVAKDKLEARRALRDSYAKGLEKKTTEKWGELTYSSYKPEHLATLDREIIDLTLEANRILEETRPYDHEYVRRGRWNRYYLVLNGNGHVHRGMECATCYPTTRYGWLTTLSDCNEAAMVAQYGHAACTVCFPDAPVERLRAEHEAALYCPGSGKSLEAPLRQNGFVSRNRHRTCPDCGKSITINSQGIVRKHRKESA